MKMLLLSRRAEALCVAAVLALAAMTGCADDNDNSGTPGGGTTPTTYQGGYADSGNGLGGLSFTIAPTSLAAAEKALGGGAVEASGEVHPLTGSSVALSGTYDPGTFTIQLSQLTRGNTTYSLIGTLAGGTFHGTITTPTGNGGWAAVEVEAVSEDTIYCGSYNCDTCEGGGGGYFDSILFGSTAIIGVRSFADTSTTIPLAGTVSGSTVTVDDQGITATGAIEGTGISGTYEVPADSESGTWSGSTNCFTKVR